MHFLSFVLIFYAVHVFLFDSYAVFVLLLSSLKQFNLIFYVVYVFLFDFYADSVFLSVPLNQLDKNTETV